MTTIFVGGSQVTGPMTETQRNKITEIINSINVLRERHYSMAFCRDILKLSFRSEGVEDLLRTLGECSADERDEIVCDLVDHLDDDSRELSFMTLKSFNDALRNGDIEALAEANQLRKSVLRNIVLINGGVGVVAELSGIPFPYLEKRMLSGGSILRRNLVTKLVGSLNLNPEDYVFPWMR